MTRIQKTLALFTTVSSLAIGVFAALPKETEAKPKPGDIPVIVELFTSEGCSSCPPADAAIKELARTQAVPGANIIALGYHVDYWNRLGWRDPFSSAEYSQRQNAYREHFNNSEVYTPQAIVNGTAEFVGSDTDRARSEIAKAADRLRHSSVKIEIVPQGQDSYSFQVTGSPTNSTHNLFVAVTENGLSTEVKQGENAGRHLAHVSVVRRLIPVGKKSKTTLSLPVEARELRANQHIVAWVQDGDTGSILAANQIGR